MTALSDLGFAAVRFVTDLGRLARFAAQIGRAALAPPLRVRLFVDELFKLGVLSLVIICVCGLAVGMVLSLVLTALLATGRAGSATTAEIRTMVATEQLDALRMMSVDPIDLVATPRALAMVFVMPMLAALFIVFGLFGGYLVGVGLMGVDPGSYMSSLQSAVDFRDDVGGSLLKALIFGVLVGLIATYRGFFAAPTSAGVGAATTSTVVVASVSILIFDYFITALWGV